MTHHKHGIAGLLAVLTAGLTACALPAGAASSPAAAPPSVDVVTMVDGTLERPGKLSGFDKFAFESMSTNLKEAADLVNRGENPTFSCVSVLVHAEGDSADAMPDAARKAIEQCGREIPLAWAADQLDTIESTGDVSRSIGECANALVALDQVGKRFTDPRTDQLRARRRPLPLSA